MSPYAIPGLIKEKKSEEAPKIKIITVEMIVDTVCDYLNEPKENIKKKIRKREVVKCRHIIGYLSIKHTDLSLKNIAEQAFGHRDHSMVIYYSKTCRDRMDVEPPFKFQVRQIEKFLV